MAAGVTETKRSVYEREMYHFQNQVIYSLEDLYDILNNLCTISENLPFI
jgi:hypothetical protein